MTRSQNSIQKPVALSGFGLFSGRDVNVRFLPADENRGIVFRRVDLQGHPEVPAQLNFLTLTERRTSLTRGEAHVELTEHVLAALAGLRIDNCIVELDAPELPGMDGSAVPFVERLLAAGIAPQTAPRGIIRIDQPLEQVTGNGTAGVRIKPYVGSTLAITYHLDYGKNSPIRPQTFTVELSPETFVEEIAFARTFVLESEIAVLRAAGYGSKTTERDLLIFGSEGLIGNQLRAHDECARHKLLDCIGDFALLGCDLIGHIDAWRSGHHLNQRLAADIRSIWNPSVGDPKASAA